MIIRIECKGTRRSRNLWRRPPHRTLPLLHHLNTTQRRKFGIPRIQVVKDEDIMRCHHGYPRSLVRFWAVLEFGRRNKVDRNTNNASQTPLILARRRAVATVSKFVLWADVAADGSDRIMKTGGRCGRAVFPFSNIARTTPCTNQWKTTRYTQHSSDCAHFV